MGLGFEFALPVGDAGGFVKRPREPFRTFGAALAGRSDCVLPMLRMKIEYLLICRIM